jgi:hypothetical protein
MVSALAELRLGPGDEGIVADNSPDEVLAQVPLPAGWRSVVAAREGSPGHTRNAAALAASCDWLLFLDSDTEPPADLLDRFFADDIPGGVGLVGGTVLSDASQTSAAARWADSRGMTAQETHMIHPFRPYFLSACLLVRRAVWDALGGFYEGIFNGEDVDFCWRAADAGWALRLSEDAAVVHLHRETVRALVKQAAVRGASATWLSRRWPSATRPKRPNWLHVAKGMALAPAMAVVGQVGRGQLRALDVATQIAERYGNLQPNRARERPPTADGRPVEVWCEEFPVREDCSVAAEARALARRGHSVLVVAARRPKYPAPGVHDIQVRYLEDDTNAERLRATARVWLRRPVAGLRGAPGSRGDAPALRVLAPAVMRLRRRPGAELRADPSDAAAPAARRASALAGRPQRALETGGP